VLRQVRQLHLALEVPQHRAVQLHVLSECDESDA
jgi:hypothetical protein